MGQVTALRNPAGQFSPGQSGNPGGRPKGSRNKATALVEALMDGEAEALVRKAIEVALAGNVRLLKTFVELLIAKPKGRPVELDIEPGKEGDPMALLEAGMRALCAGEISPADALPIARMAECSSRMRARETMAALRREEGVLRAQERALRERGRQARRIVAEAAARRRAAKSSGVVARKAGATVQPENGLYFSSPASSAAAPATPSALAVAPADRLYPASSARQDSLFPPLSTVAADAVQAAHGDRLPAPLRGSARWLASAAPIAFAPGFGASRSPVISGRAG